MPANAKQPMQRKALGIAVMAADASPGSITSRPGTNPARDRARGTPHHRGHAGDRALAGNRGARASAARRGAGSARGNARTLRRRRTRCCGSAWR